MVMFFKGRRHLIYMVNKAYNGKIGTSAHDIYAIEYNLRTDKALFEILSLYFDILYDISQVINILLDIKCFFFLVEINVLMYHWNENVVESSVFFSS